MADLWLLACSGVAFAIAAAVARVAFRERGPLERTLALFAGFPIVILPLCTLLGALGLLAQGFLLLGLVLTAALVGYALRKQLWYAPDERPAAAGSAVPASTVPASAAELTASYAAWAVLLALAMPAIERLFLRAWEPHWDDLTYHAPMAARWLQERALILAPSNYHAYFPGNAELFAAFMMLPSKLEAYANLAGGYWLLLAALAVASIARALGASVASATLCAAAIWMSEPFVHHAASFAAVDLMAASCSTAAIALALNASAGERNLTARIAYIGCLAGLATGAKITYAPIGALALVWMFWQARPSLRRTGVLLSVFGLSAFVCGGAWYVRNAWLSGNPVFPAQLLFFDGPLTAKVREPTTLVYQVARTTGAARDKAIAALLGWPKPLGLMMLAGYALALVAIVWAARPRFGATRRFDFTSVTPMVLVWLAGVAMLALPALGPFSGSTNSPRPELFVRLRFFVGFALLGLPLLSGVVDRLPYARPWASYALAGALAWMAPIAPQAVLLSAASGIALVHVGEGVRAAWNARTLRQRSIVLAMAAALIGGGLVAVIAMIKVPQQEAARDRNGVYKALDKLPYGSVITWFASHQQQVYFPLFRKVLRIVPIAVEEDGRPYTFIHEVWHAPYKAPKATWRRRKEPSRTWEWPAVRSFEREKLVENLAAQGIEYVLFTRRSKETWRKGLPYVAGHEGVEEVAKKTTFALYKIKFPEDAR
jgi:hypothetical protein